MVQRKDDDPSKRVILDFVSYGDFLAFLALKIQHLFQRSSKFVTRIIAPGRSPDHQFRGAMIEEQQITFSITLLREKEEHPYPKSRELTTC